MSDSFSHRNRTLCWLPLLSLAVGLGMPVAAWAQDDAPQAAAGGNVGDIVVTGSRLGRTTFDTPTPVTVLGGDTLKAMGINNAGTGLNQLPAFRPSSTPATQGFASPNVGANVANLRGLGNSRNLVLINGRRVAPSTRESTIDLNLIPSVMISRMEVVTGGASAAYGSDALAGVVNIILDTDLNGFKGQIDYGISRHGDGDDLHAELAFGTDFAGGAGHFVIGGEYDDDKGIAGCPRDFCKPGGIVTNIGYATNGLPNYVRSNENGGWFMNSAGVVSINNNSSPAAAAIRNLRGTNGITFSPSGEVLPYTPGSPFFGLSQIGGDIYPNWTDGNISVPVERYTAFTSAKYDFNDSLSGFVEGSYGHVHGAFSGTSFFGSVPIFKDNPYIPDEIRAVIGAADPVPSPDRPGAPAFVLGRMLDDVGRNYADSKMDTYRFTAGLKGDLGGSWNWDAYYQYGRTDRFQSVANNLITGNPFQPLTSTDTYAASNSHFQYALDAVRDPATDNIVCRATLSPDAALRQAAAGCVPINLFGEGNVTQAGKNYILGTLTEDIGIQQHVIAANVRGDLAELPAGAVSVAGGVEYRVDKMNVVHDALSNQYAYFQNFGADYYGTSKVVEGYAEVGVPLIKDASWTKSLSLDGAARLTHYDINGFGSYLRANAENKFTRATWKLGLQWEPVDWLRVRATQSHDIRAPNFSEMFISQAGAYTVVNNRFNPSQTTPPPSFNGGSPDLKPETAETTTVGVIFQPRGFADGLRLSVDFYRIKVKDYITTLPGSHQKLIDNCFAGVQIACNQITFAPDKTITEIRITSLNLDRLLAQGLDIEAQYRLRLSSDSSLTWRGLATYVDKLETTVFGETVNRAGQTGQYASVSAPHWIVNSYLTYEDPTFNVTVQGRYIAKGVYDATYVDPNTPGYSTTMMNSINNNTVGGRFYVNLSGSVRISGDRDRGGAELFGSVNNLFDRAPPPTSEGQFPTNPTYFDAIGRYFRFGVRFKF